MATYSEAPAEPQQGNRATVRATLREAYDRCLRRFSELAGELAKETPPPPWAAIYRLIGQRGPLPVVKRSPRAERTFEFIQAARLAVQIERYLFPNLQDRTERERRADNFGELLSSAGFPFEVSRRLTEVLRRGKPGAPATRRRAAIEAYELRRGDSKKWSWPKLARKFCEHTEKEKEEMKGRHDLLCTQQLRQAVIGLQRLLGKLDL